MDISLKTKKSKKKEKDLSQIKTRNTSFLKIVFIVITLLVIIGMFLYSKYIDDKRIAVVKLQSAVIAGDVVNVETSFKRHEMLYKTYLEEGMMKVTEGDSVTFKQGYVKWEDRKDYQDWYFNSYQAEDTPFTIKSASKEMQYKNPLIENMPIGNEEYVLDINSNGINLHQLFPGTTLRMRVVFEVPVSMDKEIRAAVNKKTVYDGTSETLNILTSKGFEVGAGGLSGDGVSDFGGAGTSSDQKDDRTSIISEIIFDSIEAVDMKSTSGESIFEVYMSLLKMPLEERVPYLQTSFSDDKSSEFRSRITPRSLVLNLTRDEASRIHEFEAMGYNVKWTIVKTATSSDMLKDFITINEELNKLR